MRLLDLLHPHLDGVRRVVDTAPEDLDLAGQLHLPGHVRLERGGSAPYTEGDLVVVVLGDHPSGGTDDAAAYDVLGGLQRGARALVLAGAEGRDFAFHRLLATTVEHGLQVHQVAGFERRWPRTGLVVEAVDRPHLPAPYYGSGHHGTPVAVGEAEEARAWLRVHNEYVLSDYVARGTRAALLATEAAQATARARAAHGAGDRERVGDLQQRNGQLAASLREAEGRLRRAERQVAMLEASTSMRVGSAIIGAARRPGRSTLRLPRNLYRTWQARGARPAAGTAGPAPAGGAGPAWAARMFLSHTALTPRVRRRLVVAGVVTDRTAGLLDPSCELVRLLPNDALALVERTDPDLLLVEAAAGQPGEPWAHLATPYAPERTRELLAAVDAARSAGRPAVLWRNLPHGQVPGLVRLAASFDLVAADRDGDGDGDGDTVRWSPGVQLALFNPVGAGDRAGVVGRPRPGGAEAGAEALRGAVVGLAGSGGPGSALSDEALEVLASGARVVVLAPGQSAERASWSGLADLVHVVTDESDAESVIAAACTAGPPTPAEQRRVLRHLVSDHSVPARLAWLADVLRLPVPPASGVAVVAEVRSADELQLLAADLLRQVTRPAELVLVTADALSTAEAARWAADALSAGPVIEELQEAGVQVGVSTPAARYRSAGASIDWFLTWEASTTGWGPEVLTDLRVGTQVADADAVGYRAGCAFEYVDTLPCSGSLVSRAAVDRWGVPADGTLTAWSRRGARLLALDPAVGEPA